MSLLATPTSHVNTLSVPSHPWKLRQSKWPVLDQMAAFVAMSETGSPSCLQVHTHSFSGLSAEVCASRLASWALVLRQRSQLTELYFSLLHCNVAPGRMVLRQLEIPTVYYTVYQAYTDTHSLFSSTKPVSDICYWESWAVRLAD